MGKNLVRREARCSFEACLLKLQITTTTTATNVNVNVTQNGAATVKECLLDDDSVVVGWWMYCFDSRCVVDG